MTGVRGTAKPTEGLERASDGEGVADLLTIGFTSVKLSQPSSAAVV